VSAYAVDLGELLLVQILQVSILHHHSVTATCIISRLDNQFG